MAKGHFDKVLTHLRGLFNPCREHEPADGQLLERFVSCQEESSFTALLQRHGTMVLNVCRRVLIDEHDAEDAFQATFLVLARKAASIRKQGSVASWLYGVAYRIAIKARIDAARRRRHEQDIMAMPLEDPISEVVLRELRAVLDEEVNRLPDKYRHPVVLCYLENKTNGEAARQLGWTKGTVSGRLARARDLLRARLARRGLALSGGVLAATLAQEAAAALPSALGVGTVKTATLVVAGQSAAAGAISAPVTAMVEGVLKAMWLTKVKITATVLLAITIVGAGAALLAQQVLKSKPVAAKESAPQTPRQPLKGDLAKLQGTWVATNLEKDGEQAPAKWQFLLKNIKLVIVGRRASITNPGPATNVATFTIDSAQKPKWIDFSYIEGPERGQKIPALYRLEGDCLKLCMPNEKGARPGALATKPRSGLLLLSFQHQATGKGDGRAKAEGERDRLTREIERLRSQLARTRRELLQAREEALAQADAARYAEAVARQQAERARAEALAQKKLADKLRREAERQKAIAQKELDRAKEAAEQARLLANQERAQAERAAQEARAALEKRRQAEEAERKAREAKDRKKDKKEKQ